MVAAASSTLEPAGGDLPDYLPMLLEFLSSCPPRTSREHLRECLGPLPAIDAALAERASPYAAVAVCQFAARRADLRLARRPDPAGAFSRRGPGGVTGPIL